MNDHYHTALQTLAHFRAYFNPNNFRVHHRLRDIRDLESLSYDFFLLDRDGTLQEYHASSRLPRFDSILKKLASKAEIVSNSSFDEVRRIRDAFGHLLPMSQVVRAKGQKHPWVVRFFNGDLQVFQYCRRNGLVSSVDISEKEIVLQIVERYKKPDPLVLEAIINVNIATHRIPFQPRVVMVGDRYLTDIAAGNLAGVRTALVDPIVPSADPLALWLSRYMVDIPLGAVMSRV